MAREVVEQTSELLRLEQFVSARRKSAARQQREPCELRVPDARDGLRNPGFRNTERRVRRLGERCPVRLQQLDQTRSGGNTKYPVQARAPQVAVDQENPDSLAREGGREVRRDQGLPLPWSCAGHKDRPPALAPSERQAGIHKAKGLGTEPVAALGPAARWFEERERGPGPRMTVRAGLGERWGRAEIAHIERAVQLFRP